MGVRLLTEIGKAIEARSNLIRDNKPDCEGMPALIFEPASWMSFVGEVMKISAGKANPKLVNEILKTELKK